MKYELVLLLNQEADLKEVEDLITSLSGKIEKTEKWGEKTLTYSIKKHYKALFFSLFIDIEKKKTAELRKKLNFIEKIIRFLLLSVDR